MMFNAVARLATEQLGIPIVELLAPGAAGEWATFGVYPAADLLRLVYAIAEANLSGGAPGETWRRLGEGCGEAFLDSALGRSLVGLFRRIGVEAFLPQVPPAYGLFARYGSRSVEVLGPGAWQVRFRGEVLPAELHLGVFDAGLQAVDLRGSLEIRPRSLLDFDLCATRG